MGSFFNLNYHVVFGTKFRKRILTKSLQKDLYAYIGGIIREQRGHLIEIEGVEDHVHILAGFSPTIAVSEMIKAIKGKSSKWINTTKSVEVRFEWQIGFGAFTVSQSQLPVVGAYIRRQEEHHREQTFEDEFVALLQRHEITFERKYVFEGEHVG